jgi:hypothetical protein
MNFWTILGVIYIVSIVCIIRLFRFASNPCDNCEIYNDETADPSYCFNCKNRSDTGE